MLEYELKRLCEALDIDYNKINRKNFTDNYCSFDGAILNKQAIFDGRVFNIPKEEVCNYFVARQIDASRNSIYMTAFAHFSHKELQGLNGSQLQDKLFNEKGINWNDLPTFEKRGACYYRGTTVEDRGWNLDLNIPIFTQNRDYIERFV
jgi:tRNA(His) 5'-end guanylyltransferase